MFKLNIEEKNHKVYSFFDENGTGFKVVPARGGIVSEFNYKGKEIIHKDDEGILNGDGKIRGGMPFLFPVCGAVENTPFKSHGFSRNLPFYAESTFVGENKAEIKVMQKESNESLKVFPYKFTVEILYQLQENSLLVYSKYTNNDNKEFLFFAGFHPYFEVLGKDKQNAEIKIHSKKTIDVFGNFNGAYDFNEDEVNVINQDLTENNLEIIDKGRGIDIEVEYSKEYKYIVVWSLKGKNFICVEPWMAYMKELSAENGAVLLKPSESIEMNFIIKINA